MTADVAWRAGIALRVPTPNVSVVDLVIQVEKKTFAEEVNNAFREASAGPQKGVLAVSDLPLVSRDFALSDVSTTIDASLTMVMVRPELVGLARVLGQSLSVIRKSRNFPWPSSHMWALLRHLRLRCIAPELRSQVCPGLQDSEHLLLYPVVTLTQGLRAWLLQPV